MTDNFQPDDYSDSYSQIPTIYNIKPTQEETEAIQPIVDSFNVKLRSGESTVTQVEHLSLEEGDVIPGIQVVEITVEKNTEDVMKRKNYHSTQKVLAFKAGPMEVMQLASLTTPMLLAWSERQPELNRLVYVEVNGALDAGQMDNMLQTYQDAYKRLLVDRNMRVYYVVPDVTGLSGFKRMGMFFFKHGSRIGNGTFTGGIVDKSSGRHAAIEIVNSIGNNIPSRPFQEQ